MIFFQPSTFGQLVLCLSEYCMAKIAKEIFSLLRKGVGFLMKSSNPYNKIKK